MARPQSGGGYLFVGEAEAGTQNLNALNTYPANIPVQPGDTIGIFVGSPFGHCGTFTHSGDTFDQFSGNPPLNTPVSPDTPGSLVRYPVSATVTTPDTVPTRPPRAIRVSVRLRSRSARRSSRATRRPGSAKSASTRPSCSPSELTGRRAAGVVLWTKSGSLDSPLSHEPIAIASNFRYSGVVWVRAPPMPPGRRGTLPSYSGSGGCRGGVRMLLSK